MPIPLWCRCDSGICVYVRYLNPVPVHFTRKVVNGAQGSTLRHKICESHESIQAEFLNLVQTSVATHDHCEDVVLCYVVL